MAVKSSQPVRTLVIFVIVIVAMLAGAASLGSWKPRLGLDLAGGLRITLQAKPSTGGDVNQANLDQAVNIISKRVNGAGVSEAEVSTQGNDIIIVEIPGKPDEGLAERIGQTAQLRFRLVADEIPGQAVAPTTPAPSSTPSTAPTTPTTSGPTKSPTSPSGTPPVIKPSPTPSTNTEPDKPQSKPGSDKPSAGKQSVDAPSAAPSSSAPATSTSTTTTTAPSTSAGGGSTTAPTEPTTTTPTIGPPAALVPPQLVSIPDPYAWNANPGVEWLQRLAAFDCSAPLDPTQPGQIDLPDQPLLACDSDGNKYLLGPTMVDGTDVTDAKAGIPQGSVSYVVDVSFNGDGAKKFGDVTARIANQQNQLTGQDQLLAIVLDGQVVEASRNSEAIRGGQAEISGGGTPFTFNYANNLANTLRYGALPLTFTTLATDQEGPELASNQLHAGILAGIIGLILVIGYCLLYYRGLSVVIVASLAIAGVLTYAAVLLLGHSYGFTMTLPGIAGFIVAVGITADSFIVYFERLRDEVRDGRTLRTSVETGWVRARTTILAADTVSFLAALVLFIFAIGVVKGFAFALGLSTIIDVFVVFFWTKPMVTLLARTKFFGQGHKWSGLDRQHLGMPPLPKATKPAAGEA